MPHPFPPLRNLDSKIFSKVGLVVRSTLRHALTRAAASPSEPPPSASVPSSSLPSPQRSSSAIDALAKGDSRPS